MKYVFLLCGMLFINSTFANATDLYSFSTENQQRQFNTLIHELRCLVCQNQTLAESNAGLALDLKNQIASKLRLGFSSAQIKEYLIQRYGETILYMPPLSKHTWILWFGPFALLLGGCGSLIFCIVARGSEARPG